MNPFASPCRAAVYGTARDGAHAAHDYFPHAWAEAVTCAGWTATEHTAALAAAACQSHAGHDGATLTAHPFVLVELQRLIASAMPAGDLTAGPVQALFGVPLAAGALAGGTWELDCPACPAWPLLADVAGMALPW